MITPELLDFIEAELAAGQSREELFRLLKEGGGWTNVDVEEALAALEKRKRPVSIADMKATSATTARPALNPTPKPVPPPIVPEPAIRVGEVLPLQASPKPFAQSVSTETISIAPAYQKEPMTHAAPIEHVPVEVVASIQPAQSVNNEQHVPTPPVLSRPEIPTPVLRASAPVTMQGVPIGTTMRMQESVPAPVVPTVSVPGASLRMAAPRSKKIFVILAVLMFTAMIGIGAFVLFKGLSPANDKTLATMYASIPGIQSVRYNGETTMQFSGSVEDSIKAGFPTGYTGSAKVALKYEGRSDLSKGMDGVHQFGITADLRSGDAALTVNSSVEVRIIGDTYYLKVTNPPQIQDIDLSRLNTYWIAISPSDIAEYFGASPAEQTDSYGVFGGAATTSPTFRGLLNQYPPFTSVDRIGEEDVAGAHTIHYRFVGNADNLLRLLGYVIGEAQGVPFEAREDTIANLRALLATLSGDIWIDSTSFLPRKLVLRQPLSGTVSGIALNGSIDSENLYSEYNGTVSVSAPRPVLTYKEFAEDVRRQSERAKATGDQRRIYDAEDIASALEVYRANHDDRYPVLLDELVTGGLLKSLPADPDGGVYLYMPITEKGKTSKKFLCTATSTTCTYFHLGVTLSTSSSEVLSQDSDLTSEIISGADSKGCAKEVDKSCYDITPVLRTATASSTSTQ
jgi:hypothetical protein